MQKTISSQIIIGGIGIHSGKNIAIEILPAEQNTGIIFNVNGENIEAKFNNVSATQMSTTLSNGKEKVDVIEHLMAALWGVGIDNTIIKSGAEIPVMDGSAIHFINSFNQIGIIEQKVPKKYLIVKKTVEVVDGDKFIKLIPNSEKKLTIDMTIDFSHKAIGRQQLIFDSEIDSFENSIASARTFGFLSDLEMLKKHNMGLGASLENCVGIDDDGVMNEEGLRCKDEFVRHKILDCIGDLFLSGYRILCHVEANKTGHKLNNLVLHELFADESNYEII